MILLTKRCREKGLQNPYRREQFIQRIIELQDGIRVLKISFPDVREASFCRRIYAFLSEDNKKPGYYCIENGSGEYPEDPFLSEWIPYGKSYSYYIYNSEGLTSENELQKCTEIYRDIDPFSIAERLNTETQPQPEFAKTTSPHERT